MLIPLPTSAAQFAAAINLSAATAANSAGYSGYTTVDLYKPAAFVTGGSSIKLSVISSPSASATLAATYIGLAATSGNPYNFDGSQVQITWNNGNASLSMASGGQIYTSDIIAFNTSGLPRAVLIASNISGTSSLRQMTGLNTTNFIRYYHSGVQEAASTLKTSSYNGLAGASLSTYILYVS